MPFAHGQKLFVISIGSVLLSSLEYSEIILIQCWYRLLKEDISLADSRLKPDRGKLLRRMARSPTLLTIEAAILSPYLGDLN